MIRRPPRSTQSRSSAASDVYKRQDERRHRAAGVDEEPAAALLAHEVRVGEELIVHGAVSYTHLRAHETVLDLVCRLLLEKKKKDPNKSHKHTSPITINSTKLNNTYIQNGHQSKLLTSTR